MNDEVSDERPGVLRDLEYSTKLIDFTSAK
jgi:hypothetical protein